MEALIKEITAVIIDKIKNNKVIWLLVIGYLILVLKEKAPTEYNLLILNFGRTFERIYVDFFPTIFIIVVFTSIIALMKHSDKKRDEYIKDRELRYEIYESDNKIPFQINILENTKFLLFDEIPYREISLINNSGFNLEYANGQIDFYKSKERKFSVNFNIYNLKNGYGHFIEKQAIHRFGFEWDEFDLYIKNAEYGNRKITNARYGGLAFYILPPDLKRLKKKWFERFIPYNLDWLKDMLYEHLLMMIRWNLKRQTYYERIPTELTRKNIRRHFIQRIVTILVLCIVFVWTLLLSYHFFVMLSDIALIWGSYLWNLLVKVVSIAYNMFPRGHVGQNPRVCATSLSPSLIFKPCKG